MAIGYRTVGKLQNCLLATAIQKNLISVSHVCRDLNAFVTDDVRCACFEKGPNKPCTNVTWPKWAQRYNTSHTCDLEWLGINILDAAPDLTVTQERSQMIHAYLTGTAMEHQVTLGQESRQT